MAADTHNPHDKPLYVSPEAEAIAAEVDSDKPPAWPKVIGIISIVLASLSLVCGTGSNLMQMAGVGGGGQGFSQPPMAVGSYIYLALNTVLNIILLVGGIFLVSRSTKARAALLLHAGLKIPATIYGVIVAMEYGARMIEAMKNSTVEQEAEMAGAIGAFMNGMMLCLSTPAFAWPVFLLVWFLFVKRSASAIRHGVVEQAA